MALSSAIAEWLTSCFDLPSSVAIEDFFDGVSAAKILRKIDAEHFDAKFASQIRENVGANSVIAASNVKKLLSKSVEYNESLGSPLGRFPASLDAHKIAVEKDQEEIGRLLQLILGCAVNCDAKQVQFNPDLVILKLFWNSYLVTCLI